MLKTRVIPCLDVKEGRVVKGVNFVDLRDAGDPVECAIAYDAAGADELCFLDITASHEERGMLLDVVRRTAEACFMPLTVGGGVRTLDDIRSLLLAGADKASINDRRRRRSRLCATRRRKNSAANASSSRSTPKASRQGRWEIFTHGGRRPTGIDAVDYAREVTELGAGEILLTSMDRDGAKTGFDIELTRTIADAVSVPVIASGGVGTLDHLVGAYATATPARCSRLRFSISANTASAGQALYGRSRTADASRSARRLNGQHIMTEAFHARFPRPTHRRPRQRDLGSILYPQPA